MIVWLNSVADAAAHHLGGNLVSIGREAHAAFLYPRQGAPLRTKIETANLVATPVIDAISMPLLAHHVAAIPIPRGEMLSHAARREWRQRTPPIRLPTLAVVQRRSAAPCVAVRARLAIAATPRTAQTGRGNTSS